ncbi:hypothetical protein [Streptomyces sp. NRRL S-1022]|uniref:hypothetical protein n=1 Tax=Streptomyces sp. NRRL S-1022 TaxID=1463880 RepID=UPI0004C012B7|nr:hypothetical protein [Streptomyces sp. NRRL S-1022]
MGGGRDSRASTPAVRPSIPVVRASAPAVRLRVLTFLWGAEQLLDGALGPLAAVTLPPGTVSLLDRVPSFLLLDPAAGITAGYARRFRTRHALPLLGTPAPATGRPRRGGRGHGTGAAGDVR